MLVSYLPDPEKHPLWPEILKLLEPAAFDCPEYEPGQEFVWIAFDGQMLFAAGTTALRSDGIAEIHACGGARHKDWIQEAEAKASAWARQCGATKLAMWGRKGWARYFRAFGWVVLGEDEDGRTIYEKVL